MVMKRIGQGIYLSVVQRADARTLHRLLHFECASPDVPRLHSEKECEKFRGRTLRFSKFFERGYAMLGDAAFTLPINGSANNFSLEPPQSLPISVDPT